MLQIIRPLIRAYFVRLINKPGPVKPKIFQIEMCVLSSGQSNSLGERAMIIAIDGPAASGKGTIAKALAAHYGLPHLDSGLLYRAVGRAVLDRIEAPDLEQYAVNAAKNLDKTQLDAEVLSSAELALAASTISHFETVRAALRQFQQDFACQPGGAVLDGRDMGTKICPDADVKFYVTAEPEVRARRRTAQLQKKGNDVQYEEILAQIQLRDESDRQNPAGAFYFADDAHLLDTTRLDIEAALRHAIEIVDGTMARRLDQGSGPK